MPKTQPAKPVLSPATFGIAVLRLAAASDDELREWDRRLPAELRRERIRRSKAARRDLAMQLVEA
jgi:hypothetical protein